VLTLIALNLSPDQCLGRQTQNNETLVLCEVSAGMEDDDIFFPTHGKHIAEK
jgi:hypothetical protein